MPFIDNRKLNIKTNENSKNDLTHGIRINVKGSSSKAYWLLVFQVGGKDKINDS